MTNQISSDPLNQMLMEIEVESTINSMPDTATHLNFQQNNTGGLPTLDDSYEITADERRFLLAAERGDAATIKSFLNNSKSQPTCQNVDESLLQSRFDINCVDPLGRNALLIVIENEHIELLELLLNAGIEMGDALLHAINEENLEAVEIILAAMADRQAKGIHQGYTAGQSSSSFTQDITPIILASHRDNYEIIKLLLDRGDSIPKPHDLRCSCNDCTEAQKEDSLRHSKSRINAYRALASPSLIALSSKDPILTAFELSWELRRLGRLENEFKTQYEELSQKCQDFATALLEQTRGSQELAIILNHSNGGDGSMAISEKKLESKVDMNDLARLKLAIKYKQKKFVAHPHCQQLLASLWYEGLPGFRRRPFYFKVGMIFGIAFIFPFICLLYLIAPKTFPGGILRKPFIKFLCHSASYMVFLFLLILSALRIDFISRPDLLQDRRGNAPTFVECVIIVYIAGFIWQEVKELWTDGVKSYVTDMWNLLDFATNSLYVATISLRAVAYVKINQNPSESNIPRKYWDSYDPTLISECLFAAANIFSTLKLVYIFTVNPHLGPLQISLGRMINDILKFFCLYILVLVAFACGLNQLLWFYAKERQNVCSLEPKIDFYKPVGDASNLTDLYQYCVSRGRYFTNLFEIVQSLYWSTYGLIDLENLNLEYPHQFTEFVGKLMFGVYSYIAMIVLLNMLIAMMNNSYQIIAEQADTEWKFARSKLWISYFQDGATLPVPFNIIPSPKTFLYLTSWFKNNCLCKKKSKKSRWQSIKKIVSKVNEVEQRYQRVMMDLIKRYLMQRQRQDYTQGVTEDDLNEIKGDISAFRFELLEILRMNGMKTPDHIDSKSTNKLRRRGSKRSLTRLTKTFGSASTASTEDSMFSNPMGESFNSASSIKQNFLLPPAYPEHSTTQPSLLMTVEQLTSKQKSLATPHYMHGEFQSNTKSLNASTSLSAQNTSKKVSFTWHSEEKKKKLSSSSSPEVASKQTVTTRSNKLGLLERLSAIRSIDSSPSAGSETTTAVTGPLSSSGASQPVRHTSTSTSTSKLPADSSFDSVTSNKRSDFV